MAAVPCVMKKIAHHHVPHVTPERSPALIVWCRADVKTGKLEELLGPEEVGLPNGMAWDTARRTMYFVDTYAGICSFPSISTLQ